ncbi:MAG: helical backbone metal receptor [Ekhidna sp.]
MGGLRTVIDQMGREVSFTFPLKRIVSLVPSQTEFLLDIGAPVVGRTKFCVHPKSKVETIPIVGGTKKFRFETIRQLQPDLIIGNKEENYEEGITSLESDFPVWMSDIYTLQDAFDMMDMLGSLCGLELRAQQIIDECEKATSKVKDTKSGKILYLIWSNPWMVAGKDTFIDHMLTHLGYTNVTTESRYPELTTDDISKLEPDYILLSSEPYPFKEKHLEAAKNRWPNANIRLVDGELYSWYGSRLREWG